MPGEPAPDATAQPEPQRPLTPVLEDPPVGRVRRFVGRLVRWVTWLVVVGGVGVGLYYAWPMVRDRVVRPVEANTVQVAELTQRVESIEERLAGLEAQVAAVGADLETVRAAEADTAGEVGAQGTRVEGFDRRLRTLERATCRPRSTKWVRGSPRSWPFSGPWSSCPGPDCSCIKRTTGRPNRIYGLPVQCSQDRRENLGSTRP